MSEVKKDELVGLTAQVVAAYVSNNTVQPQDLSGLINEIHMGSNGSAWLSKYRRSCVFGVSTPPSSNRAFRYFSALCWQ